MLDRFGSTAYTNDDGSIAWAGPWAETNDDGAANAGNVQVITGELRISSRAVIGDADFESIQRPVNLLNITPASAVLSFSYRTANLETTDTVRLDVYNGSTWTPLETFSSASGASGSRYYDISAYADANSAIRFAITGSFDQTNESFFVDNVQINYFSASSHTATDVRQTVQTYYIPVPEDQALLMMDTINANANSPTAVYVSISVNADNTVIYFDHWEDDFETSVTDPAQDTTEVWGDNDFTNGAPPGYAVDILNGGDIIVLNNWVYTDHLDWIDFDGGDKIASTEAIAVTRTSWASGSGTLHGGSVEMLDTSVWGTRYDFPVHDTAYYDFTYTGVALMASQDNTSIYLNGAFVATINEGQSYLFNDSVAVGDIFTSSAPVQANLLNGNIGSNYASDWLTLYPYNTLGDSYYAPVGPEGAVVTAVYLHNPNDSAITVNWETTAGAQTPQNIPAHQGVRVTMPTAGSGAHFYTTGATPPAFQAISTINSGGQANDWGYTLIPQNQLTQQAMVGWGVGRDPTSATNPAENGSPVWVIAVGSGSINVCIDYNGDNAGSLSYNGYNYDQLLPLNNLARGRVYDSDGDQTGMLLFLCNGSETGNVNKIAVAWGQDPATASASAPGLDVGTSVPPLPNFTAIKGAELIIDLNSNTRFDVRDTFEYDIVIKNTGALPVPAGSIDVSDIVPQYTTYITGSTTFSDGTTTTPIPDNIAPATVFPLDEGGYTINQTLPIEGEFIVSFRVQIDPSLPGLTTIQNNAQVNGLDLEYDPRVEIVVQPPLVTNAIGNRVWIDENGDGLQNPGEPGLPNVTVELYDSTGLTLLDSLVTDLNGNYLFPELASGTYQVRVNAASLPSGLSVSTLGTPGTDFNNQSQPYSVTVGGGENMTADFGYNWASAVNVNGNTGTGAIGDRLWVDADGDGLQDPGEPGLGGVTVRLLTDDNADGVYGGAGDNPAASATTDDAGNYIFTNLAAGSYVIEVNNGSTPAGYTQTGDPDSTADNRTSQPLVLAPGDVYLNADFGYRPSGLSGAIGSTLWFNADGDSTQDVGEYGLPGVSVSLVRDTNGNGVWEAGEPVIATDITDAAGDYRFTGLPLDDGDGDADYLVWVNDGENVLGELAPNYDSDGLAAPASGLQTIGVSAVALSAGSPANNDQDFGYAPSDPVNLAETGVIGDTVFLDRNGNGSFDLGEGLENVEVELLDPLGTLIAYTRTDENGHYAFGGVPDGTYTINIVQSTLPNGGAGLTNSVDPDSASPGDGQSSVTLSAGSRVDLDQDFGYTDGNPGTVSGTLWADTDADGLLEVSESGRLSGVTVALLDADGDVVAVTTTDSNGDYSFPGLPAGTYRVHLTDADNALDGSWHTLGAAPGSDGNSQSDPYTVNLGAGGANVTADFGYSRTPASLGDFVWNDLDHDGLQEAGEPGLAGITVTLTIAYPDGTVVTLVDVTDGSGAYTFGNLLLDEDFDGAGSGEPAFSLAFSTPANHQPAPTDQGGDDSFDSDGTTIVVAPLEGQSNSTVDCGFYTVADIGDRIWLDLDGDGAQDTGEPGLSGVVVELSDGLCTLGVDCLTDMTDANGNYAFSGLPGGNYTVVVRTSTLPGGMIQTWDPDAALDSQHSLTVSAPGSYPNVDFGYRGTASISNFVWNDMDGDGTQDAGESGLSGVTVWVDLNDDGIQDAAEPYAVTDANGLYTIGGLPAGTYTVRTGGAPISGAAATFDLDGSGTANVVSLTLIAGETRTDVDWGYQFAALSISKISSAGGNVNPGDTIEYTITVRNNTLSQQTGIAVNDPLPGETTYVTGSVTGYKLYEYRDNFVTGGGYNQTAGLSDWSAGGLTPWTENNDGTGSSTGGTIQIVANELRLRSANGDSIQRTVPGNLSGQTVMLEIDYRETANLAADDGFYVELWNGTGWTPVISLQNDFGNPAAQIVDISSYARNGDTQIRIRSTYDNSSGNEDVFVDYVRIYYTANVTGEAIHPPSDIVTAADNFVLDPGQEMQITYQVTVNDPVLGGLASIDNTASVTSAQQAAPQQASTSDMLPPSSIGDLVWLDRDGDGLQDADEPGIVGAAVALCSDPACVTVLQTTTSGVGGMFSFTATPGDYYLKFVLDAGYTPTLQSQGADGAADSDADSTTGITGKITLNSGQANNQVDAGFFTSSLDLGDLPNAYPTLFSPGPAHIVFADGPDADSNPDSFNGIPAVWLGAMVDVESNGQPTTNADGDGADEDGLSLASTGWLAGQSSTATVTINSDTSGTTVYFGLWIDWDNNGSLETFYSGSGVSGSPVSIPVTVSVPASYVANSDVYMRVRTHISPLTSDDYQGTLVNGEVEDFWHRFSASGTTTPVTVSYFRAERAGAGVVIEWSTSTESGNVGFNLYGEKGGELLKLNGELIASASTDSLDQQDYSFEAETDGERFYVEEVSILGETRRHGPFELGEEYGERLPGEQIEWAALKAERRAEQAVIPGDPARLNLKVSQTGLYRVGYAALRAAGFDLAGVPLEQIGLSSRGQAVPVHITGQGGVFGPGSVIEFYGEALDSLYTHTNLYSLQIGPGAGERVKVERKAASKQTRTPLAYVETLEVERQRAYANYAPGADAWYDTSMLAYTSPKRWDFPFEVDGLADPNGAARLELVVWGVTDWPQPIDHHLQVSLNGVALGEATFNGLVEQTLSFDLPGGTLQEGTNTLSLTLPGDTGVKWDMINLDRFSLSYRRDFAARDGQLDFTAKGKAFKVTGLPGQNVTVYRLEADGPVRLAKVSVTAEGGSYSATFAGSDQLDSYLVRAPGQILAPELESVPVREADLKGPAEFLIIAHPDFIPGLDLLVQARQAEGLSVKVVDVTDLYARYSYGIFDPQAIRDYIAYAHASLGTETVLLVGGDTYDYHDYLGRGSRSYIPSLYTATGEIARFVPADPLYADVDGDRIPDLAIGRFPVRTAAELERIVQKTLDYGSKDYGQTAVFASDRHDGLVSFKAISDRLAAQLPAEWTVENLPVDDLGITAARTKLLDAMNRGTALVTFTGHSGPSAWTFSGLFNTQYAAGLTNAGRPFVAVQWGCWNTYYVDPVNNYLVHSLLLAGDKGAAAVLGASTLTNSDSEALLGELLTPKLATPGTSLGQALQDAKRQLALSHPTRLDVLLGWSLLGDPTLIITP